MISQGGAGLTPPAALADPRPLVQNGAALAMTAAGV